LRKFPQFINKGSERRRGIGRINQICKSRWNRRSFCGSGSVANRRFVSFCEYF